MTDLKTFSIPLYKFRGGIDGAIADPTGFCGSAFIVHGGILVTCRHCFEDYPLKADEWYGALYEASDGERTALRLEKISYEPSGVDLATAFCGINGSPLALVSDLPGIGHDVASFGYPGTYGAIPDGHISGKLRFQQEARWLEGYITRGFVYERPSDGKKVRSWEVDMPAPQGLSGAPLLLLNAPGVTPTIVGVVYGTHTAKSDPGSADALPSGYPFALAHYFDSLHNLRGEALGSESLGEYMTRHGRMTAVHQ
ncbi:hypothetical protein [Pseudonocardia sp.]|jgi:hypothetical protein|uniref:hypothetical protein n=1 Tax=Pseudonocardia sp. TaxID=60912 RepID=UPI0026328576|nr:hypothetical protein [Pseudonocardia sp.]